MRKIIAVALVVPSWFSFGCCCPPAASPQCVAQVVPTDNPCRPGPPLANVNTDGVGALTVTSGCTTLEGFVDQIISFQVDGDTHLNIFLRPEDSGVLVPANPPNWLIAEIVAADRGETPVCAPRGSIPKFWDGTPGPNRLGCCTGALIRNPRLGDYVRITGPLVLDAAHGGWAEIHPIWMLTKLDPPNRTRGDACAPRFRCDDPLVCHTQPGQTIGRCEEACPPLCTVDDSGACNCPTPPSPPFSQL